MSGSIALAIDFKKFTPSILKTGEFLNLHIYKDSKLVLFHIIEYFFTPPAYLLPYLNVEKERLERELESLSHPLKKVGLRVEKAVILGEFWEALKHFVEVLKPELIVLGYEPHLLKIPTAEKILERIEISFLVVKENPLYKLENILCPFDFSPTGTLALVKAMRYAEVTGSKLTVLYVINPLQSPDKTCSVQFVEERQKEMRTEWEKLIEKYPSLAEVPFITVCGDRVESIIKFSKEISADLIIMGRRGRILNIGLGSLSRAIIKNSEIPVLLVV